MLVNFVLIANWVPMFTWFVSEEDGEMTTNLLYSHNKMATNLLSLQDSSPAGRSTFTSGGTAGKGSKMGPAPLGTSTSTSTYGTSNPYYGKSGKAVGNK